MDKKATSQFKNSEAQRKFSQTSRIPYNGKSSHSHNGLIILGSVILVASLLLGTGLVVAKKENDFKRKLEQGKKLLIQQQKEKEKRISEESIDKARELWNNYLKDAKSLMEKKQYNNAIARMEEAKIAVPDPVFVKRSDITIENIKKYRDMAVINLLNKLTEEANVYLAESKVEKAISVYMDYSGELEQETKLERERLLNLCQKLNNKEKAVSQ